MRGKGYDEEKWKLSVVVEDFKELISRPEVKIVDVALPQIFKIRKPIIEYASQQGKALFVQKPLSIYLSKRNSLWR